MPRPTATDATRRPKTPSRVFEKHHSHIHALAVLSLGVVQCAMERRWPQRVQPVTQRRESVTGPQ